MEKLGQVAIKTSLDRKWEDKDWFVGVNKTMREVLKNLACDYDFSIRHDPDAPELPVLTYSGHLGGKKALTPEEAEFFKSFRDSLNHEKEIIKAWLDVRYGGDKIIDISCPLSNIGMIGPEIGNGYFSWKGNNLMIYKKDENKLYGIYVGKVAEVLKDFANIQSNCLEILKKVNSVS